MTSNSKAAHLVCVLSEMFVLSCYTFKIIPYRPIKVFSRHLWEAETADSLEPTAFPQAGALPGSHSGRAKRGTPSVRPPAGPEALPPPPGALPTGRAQSYVLGTRQNGRGPSDRAAMGTRRCPGARACPRERVAEREQRSERWPRGMIRSHW